MQIDFVCDQYPEVSIKNVESAKRGKRLLWMCIYQVVPKNAQNNGRNFYQMERTNLPSLRYSLRNGQQENITIHSDPKCYQLKNQQGETQCTIFPDLCCNHEEAYSKMIFRALRGAQLAHRSIVIKSSDTDVEVLALHHSTEIQARLYMCSGTSQRVRYVDVRAVCLIGDDVCKALAGMHSLTGCDTTSAFVGRVKKKAFDLINKRQEFLSLMCQFG